METREQYLLRQQTKAKRTLEEIQKSPTGEVRISAPNNVNIDIPQSDYSRSITTYLERYLDAVTVELSELYAQNIREKLEATNDDLTQERIED